MYQMKDYFGFYYILVIYFVGIMSKSWVIETIDYKEVRFLKLDCI